ncbi:MAG TPA: M67 family metallopeptidase [Burkholderiaceae bacterium]|nr:M67 family metallopeptidase [Burkholderiaceae bacterium]
MRTLVFHLTMLSDQLQDGKMERGTAQALQLAPALRAELETWMRAGYPNETCGLLLGRREGATGKVARVRQARNVVAARARDRFELDPADFLAADTEARQLGEEIVGIWHSHPDHPATPSETDRAAAWPGWCYVIASVGRNGVTDWRCWRLNGDEFAEEVIES